MEDGKNFCVLLRISELMYYVWWDIYLGNLPGGVGPSDMIDIADRLMFVYLFGFEHIHRRKSEHT